MRKWISLVLFFSLQCSVASFVVPRAKSSPSYTGIRDQFHHHLDHVAQLMANGGSQDDERQEKTSVTLNTQLTEEKVTQLFAWISRALAGDEEYNNLMLAIAVVFGNLGKDSSVAGQMANRLKTKAMSTLPGEEDLCGQAFSTDEREIASLGAMGAAQWTGTYKLDFFSVHESYHVGTLFVNM